MDLKTGKIRPRDYQVKCYESVTNHIRNYDGPAFVEASVSAGKTIMAGMVAKRCQDVGMTFLYLARQSELVAQTSTTLWNMDVKNSIYSASISKSLKYSGLPEHAPRYRDGDVKGLSLIGSEKTIANALYDDLLNYKCDVLVIDENHQFNWEDSISDNPLSQYSKIINELLKRNPKMRIIGLSGSPYRSSESIVGPFWKRRLINFDTEYLVGRGYLKPITFGFGHDEIQYDLSQWKSSGEQGIKDFTASELTEMQNKILKEGTTTQKIMLEVQTIAKKRGGVLITCAGKLHCEEAAKYLPPGSYGIVTDELSQKKRAKVLEQAANGELKYILQVGCLTTGIDIPRWDTIVILRNIGSLTLLIQLIGRGLRIFLENKKLSKRFFSTDAEENELRQSIIAESSAPDCLVLDYSSTLESLGDLYQNPILEEAQLSKGKINEATIPCPVPSCGAINSKYARRCIGEDKTSADGRCEYFWQFNECICGCKNDTAARVCRSCQQQLIDPNAKLTGKAYTDADYKPVQSMNIGLTSDGKGIVVIYILDSEKAVEVFYPFKHITLKNQWKAKFVFKHVNCQEFRRRILAMKSAKSIIMQKAVFDVPSFITHRLNDKGKSIISKKMFLSGREEIEAN